MLDERRIELVWTVSIAAAAVIAMAAVVAPKDSWKPPARPVAPSRSFTDRKPTKEEAESYSFKGDRPGTMTTEDLEAKWGWDLIKSSSGVSAIKFFSKGDFTIAGKDVSLAHYDFVDGVLSSISLTFDDSDRFEIQEALEEKYGSAKLDHSNWKWENKTSRIVLRDRNIEFEHIALQEVAMLRWRDAAKKKIQTAAKDL